MDLKTKERMRWKERKQTTETETRVAFCLDVNHKTVLEVNECNNEQMSHNELVSCPFKSPNKQKEGL